MSGGLQGTTEESRWPLDFRSAVRGRGGRGWDTGRIVHTNRDVNSGAGSGSNYGTREKGYLTDSRNGKIPIQKYLFPCN